MAPRTPALARLFAGVILLFVVLHYLGKSSSSSTARTRNYSDAPSRAAPASGAEQGTVDPVAYGVVEPGWTERIGLDHYADWEAGMTGRLGNGLDRITGTLGLGSIKGSLGWGSNGAKLGSLYELIATSDLTRQPAYYDKRTSYERLRLSSTRVLGHGDVSVEDGGEATADDGSLLPSRPRRHILITGGFGSLGKHVTRDLLLGLSAGYSAGSNSQSWGGSDDTGDREEDIHITILDVKDRSGELNFLLQSAAITTGPKIKGTDPRTQAFTSSERSVDSFKRAGKLRILVGDVRDSELMATILAPDGNSVTQAGTQQAAALLNAKLGRVGKGSQHLTTTVRIPPVTGIIHLAAYSPAVCRLNPRDCEDVETAGMKSILAALEVSGSKTSKRAEAEAPRKLQRERPWLVVSRRQDFWEEIAVAPNANASMLSTMKSAEALKAFTVEHPLHSLMLQLPSAFSIIGDPYAPRFDPVPHIVQSALGNLPIQIYTSSRQQEPFLAIDDASRSIIQGARMLELASKKTYLRPLGFVAEVEIVGPASMGGKDQTPLIQLAERAIGLTQSQSAFAEIQIDDESDSATATVIGPTNDPSTKRKLAKSVLGVTPTTNVMDALKRYITLTLKLHASHLSGRINVACSSPPSVPVLEEGLLALSGCNAQLLTVIEGAYYTLGCSQGLGKDYALPLALVPAVPYKEGVRGAEVMLERGLENKVDVQMRCPTVDEEGKLTGDSEIVVWADTDTGGEFADANKPDAHIIAEWFSIDFVHRDQRSFTLTLPPTEGVPIEDDPKRRLMLRDPANPDHELVFATLAENARALLWRINPICCSSSNRRKDVWDFFKEDPLLTSQVEYPSEDGSTTLADSTLSVRKCEDLRAEHDQLTKLQRFVASASSAQICRPDRGSANGWEAKDLPICRQDCTAPLVCMASKFCKCTRDRCGDPRSKGPFPKERYTDRRSFNETADLVKPSLADRVAAIPLESLVLPGARQAYSLSFDELPVAHVVDLPESIDNHMTSPACHDLDKSPLPFMGDHFFVQALRNRSVPIAEADFVMVPYFQGCYYNYLQQNTFKKLSDTMSFAETKVAEATRITGSRIVVPFTHDFGSCTGWWPKLEDVLGRSPPTPMDQAVAWQVNGDYNTRCVKPDRDVIVPAVTKHTKALLETFGSVSEVAPVEQREHLGFFAGGVRGFGALVRTKIGCGRATVEGEEAPPVSSKILYQQFAPGQRYLGTLNSSRFCLLPRGIPAWTTRTFEAIYAGCIPTFIVDRNLFPFQDILDYSKFSITVGEADAHRIEDILASYSEEQLIDLQSNLLRVREAFIFKDGEEWNRKGPLFHALVSMAMRLDLEYPQTGSCVTQT